MYLHDTIDAQVLYHVWFKLIGGLHGLGKMLYIGLSILPFPYDIWKPPCHNAGPNPLFLCTRPCSINMANFHVTAIHTQCFQETDMRISVNYMYNVWEFPRKGIMCAMRGWWWRYSGSPRSHRVGALFPDFRFLNWVISSHHTAASTHTRTYYICSSRCISGTLPLAPLTLRILNINSQERTGFLTFVYLLPLLPLCEEACT